MLMRSRILKRGLSVTFSKLIWLWKRSPHNTFKGISLDDRMNERDVAMYILFVLPDLIYEHNANITHGNSEILRLGQNSPATSDNPHEGRERYSCASKDVQNNQMFKITFDQRKQK